MKRKNPVRCSQIIYPYGIGSMVIGKGGTSFIVAGQDAWFQNEVGGGANLPIDEREYVVTEPRLQELLDVSHFRSPPAYREPRRGMNVPNVNVTVPVQLFPQWHVCIRCDRMEPLPLTQTEKKYCCFCCEEGVIVELSQMQFVALCQRGHLQDFPWSQWVHRQHNPECSGQLFYIRSGGGTITGQKVKCSCGAVRSLANVDKAGHSDTFLSFNLSVTDGLYLCRGHRPWLAETADAKCGDYIRGNLRGAANVWFAQTASAILLPKNREDLNLRLKDFLSRPDLIAKTKSLEECGNTNIPQMLRIFHQALLEDFTDREIEKTLRAVKNPIAAIGNDGKGFTEDKESPDSSGIASLDGEADTDFRFPEYQILRENQREDELLTSRVSLTPSSSILSKNFSRIVLVRRLRETRVFTGFSRVFSNNMPSIEDRKKMLRRNSTSVGAMKGEIESGISQDNWLPAVTVYGEGIFLEFNEKRLTEWEARFKHPLKKHFAPLQTAFNKMNRGSTQPGQELSPRFILIHTLAHLLIRQLAFECGYSSAALRERMYVSEDALTPMAGLLIYTADGDSSGTLGGLVEMGNPQNLERILICALDKAKWCSSDPVCSEIGTTEGQGPDSCNLAACQACALLPETSCEEFNRFLDRSLLVNLTGSQIAGFFDDNLK